MSVKLEMCHLRDQNAKLQAELKLKTRQMKDLDDMHSASSSQKGNLSKIYIRLDSIDGKCEELIQGRKRQYSDIVKDKEIVIHKDSGPNKCDNHSKKSSKGTTINTSKITNKNP